MSLLKDEDYEVLSSPFFSKAELEKYIQNYTPDESGFTINEIIENYIQFNPNYKKD